MLLYISIPTKQKNKTKMNELEIPHVMQCQWAFSNMHIVVALSRYPVVTSDRTHTGIRRVSLHSEHVYMDNVWVETSVNMNYCAIFRCTTNTGHQRFLTKKVVEELSQLFRGSLSELRDRGSLRFVFKVIILSIAAAVP